MRRVVWCHASTIVMFARRRTLIAADYTNLIVCSRYAIVVCGEALSFLRLNACIHHIDN